MRNTCGFGVSAGFAFLKEVWALCYRHQRFGCRHFQSGSTVRVSLPCEGLESGSTVQYSHDSHGVKMRTVENCQLQRVLCIQNSRELSAQLRTVENSQPRVQNDDEIEAMAERHPATPQGPARGDVQGRERPCDDLTGSCCQAVAESDLGAASGADPPASNPRPVRELIQSTRVWLIWLRYSGGSC